MARLLSLLFEDTENRLIRSTTLPAPIAIYMMVEWIKYHLMLYFSCLSLSQEWSGR